MNPYRMDVLSLVFVINALSFDESEEIKHNAELMDRFFAKFGWTTEEYKQAVQKYLE